MSGRIYILIALFIVSLTSCDDESDTFFSNTQMSFVEMLTNNSGVAEKMVLDSGDTLNLTTKIGNLRKDTTYRYIAAFVRHENSASISSYANAISANPSSYAGYEIKTDPLTTQSIWRGGNYVNMTLKVKTSGISHGFAFVDKGITTNENGTKTLHIQLYHDQKGDNFSYYRTTYLSCPLYKYQASLRHKSDSIFFIINEFTGEKTWRLVY